MMLQAMETGKVHLLPGLFAERAEVNRAYLMELENQALAILDGISDWYVDWVKDMEVKNPHAVYSGEEGGMLEVWATLYELTDEEKYLALANAYDHPSIFRKLEEGKDALTNCHANASIPWAHGAAKQTYRTADVFSAASRRSEKEMGNKDQGFLVLLRNDGAGADAVPGTLLFFRGGERTACDRSVYSVRSDLGRRGKTRYSLAERGYEILQRVGIFR